MEGVQTATFKERSFSTNQRIEAPNRELPELAGTKQNTWQIPAKKHVHVAYYSISVYLLVLVLHSCTYLFEGAFAGRQFFVAQLASNIKSSPQLGLAIGTLKMVIH